MFASVLQRSPNVNVLDEDLRTPLHIACQHGSKKVMALLCSTEKADPEAVDRCGLVPLDLTLASRTWDVLLKSHPHLQLSDTM